MGRLAIHHVPRQRSNPLQIQIRVSEEDCIDHQLIAQFPEHITFEHRPLSASDSDIAVIFPRFCS